MEVWITGPVNSPSTPLISSAPIKQNTKSQWSSAIEKQVHFIFSLFLVLSLMWIIAVFSISFCPVLSYVYITLSCFFIPSFVLILFTLFCFIFCFVLLNSILFPLWSIVMSMCSTTSFCSFFYSILFSSILCILFCFHLFHSLLL